MPGRRRRVWTTAVVAVVVVALVIVLMLGLVMSGSSEGASAITYVEQATALELARADRRLTTEGKTLEVRWSAVPSPAGGGHVVTARIRIEPSGGLSEALFAVSGTRVSPQNALAGSLLARAER